jgi:EpsI family protein
MQMKSIASILAALMCGAAIAAAAAGPADKLRLIYLEESVPDTFGDWIEVKESGPVVTPEVPEVLKKIYDEWLSRTYVNRHGDRIMLSMAWGDDQRGERQVHRPEICYPAQGFAVETLRDETLPTPFGELAVRRFTANMGSRHEPVTYWLVMAGTIVRNDFDRRMVQARLVRAGLIPDGLLFRVSSIDRDDAHAFMVQQQFVADMMSAMGPGVRSRVSGLKAAST